MQTVRKLRKRSGFTLVELLIVIIIIGILAGAMLLVAGSGTDRAEATKIISNLRSMKAAVLMYEGTPPDAAALRTYMDRDLPTGYQIASNDTGLYVGYGEITTEGIRDSLDKSAGDSGLLGSTADGTAPTTATTTYDSATHNWVWMIGK